MTRFSLSAVGADRPGIVAAVSGVLVECGCNIEDSTMSILQGQFAILLVVSAPDTVTTASLELALGPVGERFGLMAMVRSFEGAGNDDESPAEGPGKGAGGQGGPPRTSGPGGIEGWTISVHGADRTGIVHGVASALAEVGGNVVDLTTHLVGEAGAPVYVMTLRATLPAGAVGESALADVRRSAERLGVHCNVKRDEAELF